MLQILKEQKYISHEYINIRSNLCTKSEGSFGQIYNPKLVKQLQSSYTNFGYAC